ncbi:hypothetical protein ACIU1J_27630 [Azospirillum doebereinerae]|uniref:capsid assembly protein n=1 Tax=Azospirillum doebereinerae TaxID=92933 RepID=UPI001EE60C5E|nr:hypothetical protein [Azospirillum doebereinerae]MCG5241392.1 hypothetical protein [Azospirillum doebereinerae]
MAEINTPPPSDASIPPSAEPSAVSPPVTPNPAPAPPAAAPARPDWLPEDQWDAAAGKPKFDVADLVKAKTTLDERAGQVPADAAGYKVELPEGVSYKVNEADPLLGEFRAWAHKEGLTQAQFTGVLGLRAKMEADMVEAGKEAAKAELGKLGDKAPVRIDTVTQFLSAKLPAAQFEAIRGAVQTAAGVEAIETIMQMVGGPQLPGTAPPATKPRDAADILYGTNR